MKYFGGGPGGGGGTVTSVFGRTGAVVAALNDYTSNLIGNDSGVAGATVTAALNNLAGGIAALVTAVASLTPTSRVINASSPIRIDGGASANLSADRTLSVLQVTNTNSGVVPQTNGIVGQALIAAAGAGAPTWGTDFGANSLTTTGNLVLGATPSQTGLIRVSHGASFNGRNQANGGDVAFLTWGVGTADQLRLSSAGGSYRISSSGQQDTFIGATRQYSLGAGQLLFAPDAIATWSLSTFNSVAIQFYLSGSIRNHSFFGQINTAAWGTSDRVFYIVTAVAAPTTPLPVGGVFMYAEPTSSSFVWVTPAGDMKLGTSIYASRLTGASGSSLFGTSNCLRWDTSNLGFYNTAPVSQAARVGQLTDLSGGTPSSTIPDAGVAYVQATINNIHSSLVAKINAIELAIHNIGLTA